jgi:hypothetical protein
MQKKKVTPQAKAVALATRKRKLQPATIDTLALFTKSIVEQYSGDATFCSLTLSYRLNINKYYASITRYKETYARGPYSVANADGETLQEALTTLLAIWMSKIAPPKDATEALIKSRSTSF